MVSKKLNLLISLTVIVILTASFRGCECKKRELDAIDKEWVKAYSMGQLIVFKSNFNDYDTFTVNSIRDFYPECNRIERSDFQNQTISIELLHARCSLSNKLNCKVELEITKEDEREAAVPFLRVFDLGYSPSEFKKYSKVLPVTLSTTKKLYSSSLIFLQNELSEGEYIKEFYWDKKDGLIRYTTSKNEVFELFSKGSVN